MGYPMVYAVGVGSDHEVHVFKRALDGLTDYTVQCGCPNWTVPAVFATEKSAVSFADGHVSDNARTSSTDTVDEMLEAVRKAARDNRLTRVGHWRNMRIHLDGEQGDMLVEFAACVLYMRGELYGHETPDGTYLRLSAND